MALPPDQTQKADDKPAEAAGEAGFGAAFAERSADPAGQAAKAQEDGDKPSTEEAAAAASSKAPAEAAAEAGTSGAAEKADPWEGLTPEQLRERLKEAEAERGRLQQSDRSQRGRLGALTRKITNLQTELTASKATPAAKAEEKADEGDGSDADAEFKKAVEEYPDVVGPFAKKLEELQAKIDGIEKPATAKSEIDKDAEELTAAYATLEGDHPDYQQIAADPNFNAWLGDQPDKVRELANSYDPTEVGMALSKFKLERSAAIASKSDDEGETGKQDDTATDDKRKRQLEGSRQVPGKGQPAAAGVPNDFSSAFKARASAS